FLEGGGGGAAGAGFLIGNLGALEDLRGLLVGGDHLGLGDDLAVAGLLHGGQFQVEDQVVGHVADAEARGAPEHAHVHEGEVAAALRAALATFVATVIVAIERTAAIGESLGTAPTHAETLVVVHVG